MKKSVIFINVFVALMLLAINAYGQSKKCLFVSTTASTGTSSESGIIQKLQDWGYTLTIITTSSLASTTFSQYDFCYASETVNSSNLTALKNHPLPIVATEAWASKPGVLNWSNPASAANIVPEPVLIVDSTNHKLSAGFSKGDNVTIVAPQTSVGLITTTPTISIIPIAVSSSNPAKSIIYGIEKGTTLSDGGKAANRAVCIGIHESGFNGITDDGYKFLLAAIQWVTTPPPTLNVAVNSLSFGNIAINTSSDVKSFLFSGVSLLPVEGNISITAPAGFEISESNETGFSNSLTVAYTNGELTDKTIFVRFFPTEVKPYSGSITISGGGAESKTVAVSGSGLSSASPSISISTSSLNFSSVMVNTISSEKVFKITGSYLTPTEGLLNITAPAGFQVSLTSISGFATSIEIPYSGSTISEKNVYVRFTPTVVQNYSGVITISGGGTETTNLTVSGSGVSNTPPVFTADGFGQNTTGGAGGTQVTASNSTEFKNYATSSSKYIITVTASMSVGSINVASNKTIQGANENIVLTGCLRVNRANNVIIKNLTITNPSGEGSGDGIEITESSNVIVNHCTFIDCADGSLDVVRASDFVTISWCRFKYINQTTHRNVCLFGNSDSETADMGKIHVTMHHCWFDQNCTERMPSVRYGTVHVYNTYFNSTEAMYGVRTRLYAQCLVENNYFENCQNPWELLTTEGATYGKLRASGNNVGFMDTSYGNKWVANWYTYSSGTTVLIPGTDTVFTPPYEYTLDSPDAAKARVLLYAGSTGTLTSVNDDYEFNPNRISDFRLLQNYPNPFNPSTEIRYQLLTSNFVTLKIYDMLGKEVAVLVNSYQSSGNYSITFNANNLPSGIYYYRLVAGKMSDTKKLVLMK